MIKSYVHLFLSITLIFSQVQAEKLDKFIKGDTEREWDKYWDQEQNLIQREFSVEYPYEDCFREAAEKQQLPVSLILAVARAESGFQEGAESESNAVGIMQILWPSTAQDLGFTTKKQLLEPCRNIKAGAQYLRQLLNIFKNDIHHAVAAYNYGPGNINNQLASKRGISRGALGYSSYVQYHLKKIESTFMDSGTLLASSKQKPTVLAANSSSQADTPKEYTPRKSKKRKPVPEKDIDLALVTPVYSRGGSAAGKQKVGTVMKYTLFASANEEQTYRIKMALEKHVSGILLHAYTNQLGLTKLVLVLDDEDLKRQKRIVNKLVNLGYLKTNV